MAAKYFVWGEGVWREVDVASGRVSGWRRRARFVFVRRGRLLVARRRPVLRALEALAAGQPSAAADGPRLSHRSKSESRTMRKHEMPAVPGVPPAPPVPLVPEPPVTLPMCEHHHCCAHRCNNNDKQPAGKRSIATQCAPSGAGPSALTFNVKQKNTTSTAAPDSSSAEEFASTSARRPTEVNELFGKSPATKPPAAAADKKRKPVTTHPADKSGDERRERVRKRPRTVVSDNSDYTSADEPLQRSATSDRRTPAACKELIISDADVALLRGYVSRTNASALQRFDVDDAYKRLLFYAINPLVQLERCARLEHLLRTHSVGLAPVPPRPRPAPVPPRPRPAPRPAPVRQRSASADTDKENKDKHSSPNKVHEPVSAMKKSLEEIPAASVPAPAPPTRVGAARLGVSERSNKLEKEGVAIKAPETYDFASAPPRAKPERSKTKLALAEAAGASTAAGSDAARVPLGTHVISKRASQPTAKEYSNLEDHAIVAWLSGGSRACLVSGNRVWRDLQEQYERLTGRVRSWHSLRNRYLRYILPSLQALRLPPAEVSRLRAAAATGAIKTKNRLAARRHSAFQTPARGASSRRPREGASSDDTAAAADDDANGPSSPKRRSLRSRPPGSASKDTSNKDESGNESASKTSGSKEVNSQASISKESGSKETGSKAGSGKASGSKKSGSKAGSNKEVNSKASGSKLSGSKEVTSMESGTKPASSKEVSRAARSPRYSEVTRRFAARHRPAPSSSSSPPQSSRTPSPVLEPARRSRRLFNPNTNM